MNHRHRENKASIGGERRHTEAMHSTFRIHWDACWARLSNGPITPYGVADGSVTGLADGADSAGVVDSVGAAGDSVGAAESPVAVVSPGGAGADSAGTAASG